MKSTYEFGIKRKFTQISTWSGSTPIHFYRFKKSMEWCRIWLLEPIHPSNDILYFNRKSMLNSYENNINIFLIGNDCRTVNGTHITLIIFFRSRESTTIWSSGSCFYFLLIISLLITKNRIKTKYYNLCASMGLECQP